MKTVHFLFTFLRWTLATLLLAVAVTATVFWYRGQFTFEQFVYRDRGVSYRLWLGNGLVTYERESDERGGVHEEHYEHQVETGLLSNPAFSWFSPRIVRWSDDVFEYDLDRWGLVVQRLHNQDFQKYRAFRVRFPTWWPLFLATPFAVMVAARVLRRRRARDRTARGLCHNCGYDLRGTDTPICAECGEARRRPTPSRWSSYLAGHPRLRGVVTVSRWTAASVGLLIAVTAVVLWVRGARHPGRADLLLWGDELHSTVVASFGGLAAYNRTVYDQPDPRLFRGFSGRVVNAKFRPLTIALGNRVASDVWMGHFFDAIGLTTYHIEWTSPMVNEQGRHRPKSQTVFQVQLAWVLLAGLPFLYMAGRRTVRRVRRTSPPPPEAPVGVIVTRT